MSTNLHPNQPAVKSPVIAAEWAAYAASNKARRARLGQPLVPWQPGDRVLYRTPRSGRGGGRSIRGTIVKVNAKTVTIEYAMLDRLTKEVAGYERRAVNPMALARVIEPVTADDVNWGGGGKKTVEAGGWQALGDAPQAAEMPWEVLLDEVEKKPGLWFDEPDAGGDELEFMGAALNTLRLGLAKPVALLTAEQMDEIEDERVGWEFSREPFAY